MSCGSSTGGIPGSGVSSAGGEGWPPDSEDCDRRAGFSPVREGVLLTKTNARRQSHFTRLKDLRFIVGIALRTAQTVQSVQKFTHHSATFHFVCQLTDLCWPHYI